MNLPAEFLHKLRETIRNTEDVGRRFPEEARKIHYEEIPARAIRGQASPEEADELREEGIEFASLPLLLSAASLISRGPSAILQSRRGPLAQLVEQRTFNPLVVGSSPARPTKRSRG